MNSRLLAAALAMAALSGCKEPLHLQYDYGRAFIETLRVQADLTRPSVSNDSFYLYGPEGAAIRLNVQSESSAQESGEATVQD